MHGTVPSMQTSTEYKQGAHCIELLVGKPQTFQHMTRSVTDSQLQFSSIVLRILSAFAMRHKNYHLLITFCLDSQETCLLYTSDAADE